MVETTAHLTKAHGPLKYSQYQAPCFHIAIGINRFFCVAFYQKHKQWFSKRYSRVYLAICAIMGFVFVGPYLPYGGLIFCAQKEYDEYTFLPNDQIYTQLVNYDFILMTTLFSIMIAVYVAAFIAMRIIHPKAPANQQ